ncbi:tyrosine-type recombinase/integrase [Spirillospora sp. CA-108201]
MEAYLAYLHARINPRNGRPLAARTRYTYISPLLNFFREAGEWGWDDVPTRPVLGRTDLPKLPSRLPRFIPREELDRLMKAVEGLDNPYQRAALLLLRWGGARKNEILRLTIDCLDAYPDGYPRLRIPVGKTYTERMIPLHPQAADALRELIESAKAAAAAARFDTWAQQPVRWVFMHRGQPMSKKYLFDEPLELACTATGLIDGAGRPTVSPHRTSASSWGPSSALERRDDGGGVVPLHLQVRGARRARRAERVPVQGVLPPRPSPRPRGRWPRRSWTEARTRRRPP